jgi:hypothetical protein
MICLALESAQAGLQNHVRRSPIAAISLFRNQQYLVHSPVCPRFACLPPYLVPSQHQYLRLRGTSPRRQLGLSASVATTYSPPCALYLNLALSRISIIRQVALA